MEFTRSRFGVEIKPSDFTLYKSKAKGAAASAKKAEPAKRGPKPKAASPAPDTVTVASAPKAASNSEADLIESLETLKPLIASMGADRVKRLVDLLG